MEIAHRIINMSFFKAELLPVVYLVDLLNRDYSSKARGEKPVFILLVIGVTMIIRNGDVTAFFLRPSPDRVIIMLP